MILTKNLYLKTPLFLLRRGKPVPARGATVHKEQKDTCIWIEVETFCLWKWGTGVVLQPNLLSTEVWPKQATGKAKWGLKTARKLTLNLSILQINMVLFGRSCKQILTCLLHRLFLIGIFLTSKRLQLLILLTGMVNNQYLHFPGDDTATGIFCSRECSHILLSPWES